MTSTANSALNSPVTEAVWRGPWVTDWALGTLVLLRGGAMLGRQVPLGHVSAPGLLLVSAPGGVAFAAAAAVNDATGGGPQTQWSVDVLHMLISGVSFAILVWFLPGLAP